MKTKARHTPGPWRIVDGYVLTRTGNEILAIHADTPEGRLAFDANARLVEVAPDMLELLKEARTALNWQGAEYLAKRIASVIAKAEPT